MKTGAETTKLMGGVPFITTKNRCSDSHPKKYNHKEEVKKNETPPPLAFHLPTVRSPSHPHSIPIPQNERVTRLEGEWVLGIGKEWGWGWDDLGSVLILFCVLAQQSDRRDLWRGICVAGVWLVFWFFVCGRHNNPSAIRL